MLDQFSDRCLIIFDGFDEFYSKNEDVLKVLRGQKLLNCNIIVSSRPHSVEDIEEHFHTIVKIQGFSEDYARTYASKLLREKDKLDAVIKFNFRNFVIGSDTFTCPMLLLFICILVNSDEIDLRKNEVPLGEIYWRLLRCIYSKYRVRKGKEFHLKDFIQVLRKIGHLAFKAFESKQAWFQKSEIVTLLGEDAFEYGLLIGHEDFRLVGHETADVVVTFAHRSIEQFLGAFHITQRFAAGDSVSTSLLVESIMFHFCIWLIIENDTNVVTDKTRAFSLLQANTNMSLDAPVLDFSILESLSSVLSFRDAFKRKDATVIKFLEYSLSHCYRIQHLTLSTADPISNVLQSLRLSGPLPVQLKSIHIIDDFYTIRDMPLGSIRHQFMTSSGTTIILRASSCAEVERLVGETSWLLGNPSVVLLTKFMDLEPSFDLSLVPLRRISQLCITREPRGGIGGRVALTATRDLQYSPVLTRLSFSDVMITPSVFQALATAMRREYIPRLTHLSFIGCTAAPPAGSVSLLFKTPRPLLLTNLNLNLGCLATKDLQPLFTFVRFQENEWHNKVTSLTLNFGDAMDELLHPVTPLWTLDRFQKCVKWRREIDDTLLHMLQRPLNGIETLWLHDINKEEYKIVAKAANGGRIPDLTELGITMWKFVEHHAKAEILPGTRDDAASTIEVIQVDEVEYLDPINVPSITHLTLHRFICSVQHLYMVTKSKILTQLKKLDISHSSGITGTLSILLCHSFPSLNTLILSDCGLNPQDLNSLAKSSAKGRLPELKHLDISHNDELQGQVRCLFEYDSKWQNLLHLNIDGKVSTRYSQFVRSVRSGCLQSLEFLRFSSGEDVSQHGGVTWPSLRSLYISSDTRSKGEIASAVHTASEQGEFPSLNTLCVNAQLLPDRMLKSSLKSMDSSLCEALNDCIVETLVEDIMYELYDGNIINELHAEFQRELVEIYRAEITLTNTERYEKKLRSVTSQKAAEFTTTMMNEYFLTEAQRNVVTESVQTFLASIAMNRTPNVHEQSDVTEQLGLYLINKHRLADKNVNVFDCKGAEFTTGWQ